MELIAGNVNENKITFELEHDARIISRNLNLSITETKDMMQYMIKLGLFSISKNEKLACYALAKRIDQSMTSSKHFRKIINDFKANHDLVMTNHDKSCKIREDKIREDKNIKPFSFTLTQKKSIENTSNEYKNKLKEYIEESKKPMSYNFFYEYCVQKDYKYKNFKMAYDNWNKDSDTKQTQTKKLKVI